MMQVLFDRPDYVNSLTWLGEPLHGPGASVIQRTAPHGLVDARGSWPYQSVPSAELIDFLRGSNNLLTLTCVISPDVPSSSIEAFNTEVPSTIISLKEHLCHRAGGSPAWQRYSVRTRRRLTLAQQALTVTRTFDSATPAIIMNWQNKLRHHRGIPSISSPDLAHFQGLFNMARQSEDVACFSLRWRDSGECCGVFLAGHDGMNGAWHAHTALVNDQARATFGMYLLFDSVLRAFADSDLWLGGAPSGPNGVGVYTFKQRFANFSAPAKVLCVELDPLGVSHLRAKHGTYAFVPNYRNPATELRYDPNA
jgi:hypothetical protein